MNAANRIVKPTVVATLCLAAMLLVSAGCAVLPAASPAPSGTSAPSAPRAPGVTTTSSSSLVLGKTTLAQVAERYKTPNQILDRTFHGKAVRIVQYLQASEPNTTLSKAEILASPTATFFFADDILVGQNAESSWVNDATSFDLAYVRGLKVGKSTGAEIINKLGVPAGTYRYPLIAWPGFEALVYPHIEATKTDKEIAYNRREVMMMVDQAGVLRDVTFVPHDNSLPQ